MSGFRDTVFRSHPSSSSPPPTKPGVRETFYARDGNGVLLFRPVQHRDRRVAVEPQERLGKTCDRCRRRRLTVVVKNGRGVFMTLSTRSYSLYSCIAVMSLRSATSVVHSRRKTRRRFLHRVRDGFFFSTESNIFVCLPYLRTFDRTFLCRSLLIISHQSFLNGSTRVEYPIDALTLFCTHRDCFAVLLGAIFLGFILFCYFLGLS